ncbi:MAG: hypothetical protein COA45_00490 [Zetaproteobacteria bacterium]|nr:MAG: hypothetical protein COA45_00490 [Zetaproteobacteria bacterium]
MSTKDAPLFVFFAALICIVIPCVLIQGQYLVNGNISWLLIAAERLLSGQKLTEHIYETNPPLSIFLYIPHIMFSKALGLPITVGAFYFTLILVALSTFVIHLIIKPFPFFTTSERKTFILGYALSITLTTTVFFSEREHLVILALIPFVLCQYAMTRHIEIRKSILIPVMIIGAICVLVKPHYGLLPTVFLIDRMIRQKKFNIFFDIDFMTLSIMTLAYIGIIFTFFHDYIDIIFPDVLTLYATTTQPIIVIRSIQTYMYASLILCALEMFQNDLSKQKKSFLLFLYSCALLCLIPYFVQMKGFFNHVIPVYTFLICAITLSIGFRVSRFFKHLEIAHIIIPLICLAFIIHVQSPLNTNFPKQTDIPNLPVAQFLEKECSKPCTFFAFHGNIEIINPTAAYMGYTHGTRFPTLWFIPKIHSGLSSADTKGKAFYQNLKTKYIQFVADDLAYYKPSIMIIAKELEIGAPTPFDFLSFFDENQKLKDIFEQEYEKGGEFKFDSAEYFKGTTLDYTDILTYDIYRRKNVNP